MPPKSIAKKLATAETTGAHPGKEILDAKMRDIFARVRALPSLPTMEAVRERWAGITRDFHKWCPDEAARLQAAWNSVFTVVDLSATPAMLGALLPEEMDTLEATWDATRAALFGGMYSPLAKTMMKKQTIEGTVRQRVEDVLEDLHTRHEALRRVAEGDDPEAAMLAGDQMDEIAREYADIQQHGLPALRKERSKARKEFAKMAEELEKKEAASKQGKGRSKFKLLELFKGTGSVGKAAKKMGWDVVSLDLDPYYTPDIETDILKWDYKKWARDNNYTPDFIWASPPCNTFSPLAYPLKERNTKTATPYSARAKQGTEILHRVIDIISFFKRKNPDLLFAIENPRGMMRHDPEVKKLPHRDTTLYCLYNDVRYKPTDFFNNVGKEGLKLKAPEMSKCNRKDIVQVTELPLDKRYAIPQTLVKKILTRMADVYRKGERPPVKDDAARGGAISASDARLKYPKRSYESDADYQDRIDRVVAQEKRFEDAGITPEMRQTAIVAANDVRALEQMRDALGQEATQQAWEKDPDTIAKKKKIADREAENAIFNPILRGLIGLEKLATQTGILPGWFNTLAGMNADYLSGAMDEEDAQKAQKEYDRAMKQAATAGYREDQLRQLLHAREALGLAPGEPVDFARLNALIERKKQEARTGISGGGYFQSSFM